MWAVNRNDPSLPTALLTGFSTMKGILLCFVFSGTIIVGLTALKIGNALKIGTVIGLFSCYNCFDGVSYSG